MTTACIVQARMGSSRFPGKVMASLAGKPVLQHVLERCAKIPGVDVLVLAVPDEDAGNVLATLAQEHDAYVFLGSEQDVLSRYLGAARMASADVVMRITADCPLIDPDVCGDVLRLFQSSDEIDYASNVLPRTWPQGLDCEVFSMATLEWAAETATEPYDREHVTPIMQRLTESRRANLTASYDASHLRWTVDYPEDIEYLERILAEAA